MRIHPQVLQIGTDWGEIGHTKLYFLEGEKKAIIDTGVKTSPERDIARCLAYYGYKLGDIDVILNTHGHFDHADGNPSIPQAEVWMHQQEVFQVEDPAAAFEALSGYALRLMGKGEEVIGAARDRYVSGFTKQKVARVLKDGNTIDLGKGIELRVVHLPGHTMGSVGYFWEREGILFTGDSAMCQGSRPGIIPVLSYPLAYARSLSKLLGMSIGTLAIGHYYQSLRVSANPIKQGEQITHYLQDCEEVNNRILESMGKAIHQNWGAPFPVVLATAVDHLAQHLSLRREPASGLPANAVRTLGAYYGDMLKNL